MNTATRTNRAITPAKRSRITSTFSLFVMVDFLFGAGPNGAEFGSGVYLSIRLLSYAVNVTQVSARNIRTLDDADDSLFRCPINNR